MPLSFTILTPALNMARFLASAVESVLPQLSPPDEYVVLDGGSSDGTQDILKRYEPSLRWTSQPDAGPAAALRRGFESAGGDIFGWLSADDILLPGALAAAREAFEANPGAVAVFGSALWIDEHGRVLRPYPVTPGAAERLHEECLICQPACFFRAEAYRACGGIDPSYRSAFDYDLWIRLRRLGPFVFVPCTWAHSRMHASNITLGQRQRSFEEGMRLLSRHFSYVPFAWIYSSLTYQRDGADQFHQPLRPSAAAWLASLPAGCRLNRRHPIRYLAEWASQFSWTGFKRLWMSARAN